MYSTWPVSLKMLLILYIVLATCSSCLTDDLFPEALVFEGLGLSDIVNNSKPNENRNNSVIIEGDLNDALMTMDFHRKNINDYLCRQYIVEGILQDITDNTMSVGRSISPADNHGMTKTSVMKTDQGSSAYNAWLIRTKLLKRIYDEYDLNVKMHEKPVGFTLKNNNNESLETHDHETMKDADDNINDFKKPHHLNEGSYSTPSDTVSVDLAQSHSEQYDIDDEKEYKKPNRSSYHGLPDFNPKQSIQQSAPSASEPSIPLSLNDEPPLLPTYYGPPPLSNESPLSPSDFEIQFSSSYELPPYSHELPPSSNRYRPPSSSYESHSYPPKPSNGYPFLRPLHYRYPHPGLIPPTENPGPNRFIDAWHQSADDEVHNSNREPLRPALTATDMYDLTLTAIAFLGFGTFVMNLVMDAMSSQSGATLMIHSHGGHRVRRHDNPGFREINELSWTVVSTLDNMIANVDGSPVNCAEVKQLCRRSKRLVKTGTNFSSKLLPVWNVALGWLSKKLGTDSSQPVISALLGHCTLPSQCQSNS